MALKQLTPQVSALDIMHLIQTRDLRRAKNFAQNSFEFFGSTCTDPGIRLIFAAPLLFEGNFVNNEELQVQFNTILGVVPPDAGEEYSSRALWLVEKLSESGHAAAAAWLLEANLDALQKNLRAATRLVIMRNRHQPGFDALYQKQLLD